MGQLHHLVPTQKSEFVTDDMVHGALRHPGSSPRVISAPAGKLTREIDDFSSLPNLNGYLGGALSGSQIALAPRGDFDAARERYLRSNRPFIPKELLTEFFPPGYDPGHVLPRRPMLPVGLMDPQDQLNFHYRPFQRVRLSAGQYEEDELAATDPEARARAWSQMSRSRTPYTDPRWQKS